MNELITDPGLRNWIKACLGLKYVRDGMLPYMQRKCEDLYSNNETFTKTITKLTTYSCSVCCVKDVHPNHSMNNCPSKGQLGRKTKCACTFKNKKLCPNGGACGVMYDRIMDDHVSMTPRWDNSDCQQWYLNGWEQMKCFIDIPGYKDKALISQADVTAFVHICQNNKTLYTIFKSHLGKLMQVRSDRNEIYHSGDLDLTDDKLKEYLANMKAVLKIVVFNAFTSDIQEQLDKLAKLEADVGIEVNTITEIEARKEALNALIEDTITLEERNANTPDDKPEFCIQQAQFAVLQDSHMRSIADRLKGIKEEFNLCAKVLLEQSSELKSITAGFHANTKAFQALQKELVQQSELIRGIEVTAVNTNIVVTKSYRTLKDVECDVKTILLIFKEILKYNRPHARNINGTIVAEIKGAANEKHLSNEIVQAIRSQKSNPDQEANGDIDTVLVDLIQSVETDGDEMIDVRPGSIIIKILCQSMSNWINLCEKCIDGRMTQQFKPLQDHLRKNTSFGNLTITVDMLETDFIESVDTIVKQLYPHMIAALPHNMEIHRPDGIENTNVQHMNAMLKCLLEKSHQYSHQKPCADINRAQRIQFPEMQIDNGQTTCVTVDQTCMETKINQNETAPTTETLTVQNTFSGTHTDLNVKLDAISADLEAIEHDVTQPKIKQSNHDVSYRVRSRYSNKSISIASVLRESPMSRRRNSEPVYRSIGTNTAVTCRSSTDPVSRAESWDSGYPNVMPHMTLETASESKQARPDVAHLYPSFKADDIWRSVLIRAHNKIVKEMDPQRVLEQLRDEGILSHDDYIALGKVTDKRLINAFLIGMIRQSGNRAYCDFKNVLQETGQTDILQELQSKANELVTVGNPAQLADWGGITQPSQLMETLNRFLRMLSMETEQHPEPHAETMPHREQRQLDDLNRPVTISKIESKQARPDVAHLYPSYEGLRLKSPSAIKLSDPCDGIRSPLVNYHTNDLVAGNRSGFEYELSNLKRKISEGKLFEQDCIKMTHDEVTGKCDVLDVKAEVQNASVIEVVEKEKSAFKDVPL